MVRISPRSGPSLVSQARSGCHVQWAAEDETVRRHRRPSGCESEHAGRHGRTGEPGVLPSTGPRVGHGWRLGSNSRWRLERSREGTSAAQERSLVPVRAQSGLQEGEAWPPREAVTGIVTGLDDAQHVGGKGRPRTTGCYTSNRGRPSFFTATRCSTNHHPAVYFSHLQMREL